MLCSAIRGRAFGRWVAALFTAMGLTGAHAAAPAPALAHLSPAAQLGKRLFFEPALSASRRLSCASCHDPANAYGPPPRTGAVMPGGAGLHSAGLRAVPSLRYLQERPRFTRHLYIASGDETEDVGPGGGLMWDGRVDDLSTQTLLPLLDPNEMANRDLHALASRVRASPEMIEFARVFGAAALRDDRRVAAEVGEALARFELEDPSFHPYDSPYDDYLRAARALSAQQLRGLQLFNAPDKGNCAECHPSQPGPGGAPPQFTDYRFVALGVPRNPLIPANADNRFHDLGLCGPPRTDLVRESSEYCGLFRTPTLRNVARRSHFFHNGRFTTLRQVVEFYVQRDLQPVRWYPMRDGQVQLYDDLPPAYRVNVDRFDPPLDRQPGEPPALNEQEIEDLVAFLQALSDRT